MAEPPAGVRLLDTAAWLAEASTHIDAAPTSLAAVAGTAEKGGCVRNLDAMLGTSPWVDDDDDDDEDDDDDDDDGDGDDGSVLHSAGGGVGGDADADAEMLMSAHHKPIFDALNHLAAQLDAALPRALTAAGVAADVRLPAAHASPVDQALTALEHVDILSWESLAHDKSWSQLQSLWVSLLRWHIASPTAQSLTGWAHAMRLVCLPPVVDARKRRRVASSPLVDHLVLVLAYHAHDPTVAEPLVDALSWLTSMEECARRLVAVRGVAVLAASAQLLAVNRCNGATMGQAKALRPARFARAVCQTLALCARVAPDAVAQQLLAQGGFVVLAELLLASEMRREMRAEREAQSQAIAAAAAESTAAAGAAAGHNGNSGDHDDDGAAEDVQMADARHVSDNEYDDDDAGADDAEHNKKTSHNDFAEDDGDDNGKDATVACEMCGATFGSAHMLLRHRFRSVCQSSKSARRKRARTKESRKLAPLHSTPAATTATPTTTAATTCASDGPSGSDGGRPPPLEQAERADADEDDQEEATLDAVYPSEEVDDEALAPQSSPIDRSVLRCLAALPVERGGVVAALVNVRAQLATNGVADRTWLTLLVRLLVRFVRQRSPTFVTMVLRVLRALDWSPDDDGGQPVRAVATLVALHPGLLEAEVAAARTFRTHADLQREAIYTLRQLATASEPAAAVALAAGALSVATHILETLATEHHADKTHMRRAAADIVVCTARLPGALSQLRVRPPPARPRSPPPGVAERDDGRQASAMAVDQ